MKYDIFISYRRSGGSFSAKHLRDTLEEKGYRVFFDVETLRSGEFNLQLLEIIRNCRDVLVILSPGALDRCDNEGDWVRRELECALENKKNIIPVMLNGFEFPAELPASLASLPNYNGVIAAPETFDSTVKRLCSFMKSKPSLTHRIAAGMRKGPVWLAVVLLVAVLAWFGVGQYRNYMNVFPRTRAQKNNVAGVVAGAALNMTRFDVAHKGYVDALDACAEYLDAPGSLESLKMQLDFALDGVNDAAESIEPYSESLLAALADSPLNLEDVRAMHTSLEEILTSYESTLIHLRDFLLEDGMLQDSTKESYVNACRELALLDCDNVFYATNDMLLPLSDEALSEFRNSYLPEMTSVYDGQEWRSSRDDIDSVMNRINNRSKELVMDIAAATGMEQVKLDAQISYTEALTEHRQRLEEKQKKLEETRALLEEEQAKLAAKKQEAYEKFRPLESDDTGMLWGKGLRFITLKMPEAAVECFEMYARKETAEYGPVCGSNAVKFVLLMEETGVTGGCMVCLFEEGLPRQQLEVGDIIYAVDGVPVAHADDYGAIMTDKAEHGFSVLRFTEEGYEKISVPYDPEGGRMAMWDLNEVQ